MQKSAQAEANPQAPSSKQLWMAWGLALALNLLILRFGPSETLDQKLYYAHDFVYRFLDSMGPQLRAVYARTELIDLCFICAYSYALWLSLKRGTRPRRFAPLLAMTPGAFDVVETGGIWALLQAFPTRWAWLEWAVWVCTPLKWLSLVSVGARLLGRWLRRSSPRS